MLPLSVLTMNHDLAQVECLHPLPVHSVKVLTNVMMVAFMPESGKPVCIVPNLSSGLAGHL